MRARALHVDFAGQGVFDVAIIGGGINGASLYSELCSRGWRTLLIDRSDFASGSSQSSGMMIWGGLLYLRVGDVLTVAKLSRSRDRMVAELADWAHATPYRYVPSMGGILTSAFAGAGIGFYWLLSSGHRHAPAYERHFNEEELIRRKGHRGAFRYEEAMLLTSDARFTLHWITSFAPPSGAALNYCELVAADYDRAARVWRLRLRDLLSGVETEPRSRMIVNCTGVWVDELNARHAIETPYRHALSKGVYLGLPREEGHLSPLIFDMGRHGDVMTYVPWGPVALWGPTETAIDRTEEGQSPDLSDLRFLLSTANEHLRRDVRAGEIVSLRCGIRALAVKRDYSADRYPLELSRRSIVHADRDRPWISVFGGKLTGCRELAAKIHGQIRRRLEAPRSRLRAGPVPPSQVEHTSFPGIDQPLPSPAWCREHEFCCNLEDYLRRRTDIAQWVPRGGMGKENVNRASVATIARVLHGDNAAKALERYEQRVSAQHDELLAQLSAEY